MWTGGFTLFRNSPFALKGAGECYESKRADLEQCYYITGSEGCRVRTSVADNSH